jgi:hypothetical protein
MTVALSNSLADLAARIRGEHEAASMALRRTVEHAMAAGDLLLEAKEQLKHGQWLSWFSDNCAISDRTARLYMTLARNRGTIEPEIGNVADLTVRQAVALVTVPRSHAKRLACAAAETAADEWTLAEAEIALQKGQERRAIYATISLILDELKRLALANPGSYQPETEGKLCGLVEEATEKLRADEDREATALLRSACDEAENILSRARRVASHG